MTKGDWDDQRRLRMTGMIGDDYDKRDYER